MLLPKVWLAHRSGSTSWSDGLAGSYSLGYQYNRAGRLTRRSMPDDVYVDYARDYLGRVTTVGDTVCADANDAGSTGSLLEASRLPPVFGFDNRANLFRIIRTSTT